MSKVHMLVTTLYDQHPSGIRNHTNPFEVFLSWLADLAAICLVLPSPNPELLIMLQRKGLPTIYTAQVVPVAWLA